MGIFHSTQDNLLSFALLIDALQMQNNGIVGGMMDTYKDGPRALGIPR